MNTKVAIWLVSEHTGISDATLRKCMTKSVQHSRENEGEIQCYEFKTRNTSILLKVRKDKYVLTRSKLYAVRTKHSFTPEQFIKLLDSRYGVRANKEDFIVYSSNGEDFVELYTGKTHAIIHQTPGRGYTIKLWRIIEGTAA